MSEFKYKGAIVNALFTAAEKNPEMNFGEIFYHILGKKSIKKHYFEATDEEIYTSIENFIKADIEQDDILDEEAFQSWVDKHTINNIEVLE